MNNTQFAVLVSWISSCASKAFETWDIEDLEHKVRMCFPTPEPTVEYRDVEKKIYVNADDVHTFTSALVQGRKIEAIKKHREMTGFGLKESKDIIDDIYDALRYNVSA